jgi:hypothetical protein
VARYLTPSGRASDSKDRPGDAADKVEDEPVETRTDPTGPARGIVLGLLIGGVLWLTLFLLVRALLQ